MLKKFHQKRSKIEVHFSSKNTKKGSIHQQDKPPHTNASTQLATSHSSTPLVALSHYHSETKTISVPSLQILDPSVIPSHHSILDTQNPPLQTFFSKDKPNLLDTHPCFPSPSFSITATIASPVFFPLLHSYTTEVPSFSISNETQKYHDRSPDGLLEGEFMMSIALKIPSMTTSMKLFHLPKVS